MGFPTDTAKMLEGTDPQAGTALSIFIHLKWMYFEFGFDQAFDLWLDCFEVMTCVLYFIKFNGFNDLFKEIFILLMHACYEI